MKLNIKPLTWILIALALTFIFLSIMGYGLLQKQVVQCKEDNNAVREIERPMDSQFNYLYSSEYEEAWEMVVLCIGDKYDINAKMMTNGIIALIFMALAILSWKIDNLKKKD
jgi:hypothetical protein